MNPSIVIAIDGPSATGKGSVSRELARRIGFLHVDTGVMYRALTWHCLRTGVFPAEKIDHLSAEQSAAVARACASWPVKLVSAEGELCVLVDAYRPLAELRAPEVANKVALVSHVPAVREWMLPFQRGCAEFGNLVMDGRDIGTRIFRETPFKFFLTADETIRHRRLERAGYGGDQARRDELDKDLNLPAADAEIIDTSAHKVEDTLQELLKILRGRAPHVFG